MTDQVESPVAVEARQPATDQSERRERLKLFLECAKLGIAVFALIPIILGISQWRESNLTAIETLYQRVAGEWREHLKSFVDKPELRPYFEEGKALALNDPLAQSVLAVADLRLDTADAILTYAAIYKLSDQIGGWKATFSRAFKTSPVLCQRLANLRSNYGLVVPIGDTACLGSKRP